MFAMTWTNRWEDGTENWHMNEVNINLQKYVKELTKGKANCSVLVNWCGKSLDLACMAVQSRPHCSRNRTIRSSSKTVL